MTCTVSDAIGVIREFKYVDNTHRVHWRNYGNEDTAIFEVRSHESNKYLNFEMMEMAEGGATKRVMVTLSAQDAKQFYEWLRDSMETP